MPIYETIIQTNALLKYKFGIKSLHERMVYAACVLAAQSKRKLSRDCADTKAISNEVLKFLEASKFLKASNAQEEEKKLLKLLTSTFQSIHISQDIVPSDVESFLEKVGEMSDYIKSDDWHGEDLIAMFCYKETLGEGQVFTPSHIASFMCRLAGIKDGDRVLDAACGIGSMLICDVKKKTKLYGLEVDRDIYALACVNSLIYGRNFNLSCMDSCSDDAQKWIREKKITKVIMNPPYGRGCLDIMKSVMGSVQKGTPCLFVLPNTKLERNRRQSEKILKTNTLEKIIKLPKGVFLSGIQTSLFIFTAGIPQEGKKIFTCRMADDGLITLRSKGRQDLNGKWPAIEDKWIKVIKEESGDDSICYIDQKESLSWKPSNSSPQVREEDYLKTILDYKLVEKNPEDEYESGTAIDTSSWSEFKISDLFDITTTRGLPKKKAVDGGKIPYITTSYVNNGVAFYVDADKKYIQTGKSIMIAAKTRVVTYQKEDFIANDSHNLLLKLKDKDYCTDNVMLFFVSTIGKKILGKYTKTDAGTRESISNDKILVPVIDEGKPDYQYMEKYMEDLKAKAEGQLLTLWTMR